MSDSISMEQTVDGKVKATVGSQTKTFTDYISAAEWAESLVYGEGDADGH